MPIPDITGVAPNATFEDLKNKINEFIGKYINMVLNLDSLNVVSLTADHIDAGTLNANIVTIRADLTNGASIVLDSNGMRINDGTEDVFIADTQGNVTLKGNIFARGGQIGGFTIDLTKLSGPGTIEGGTIVGSLIETAPQGVYPRIELSSTNNILQAFATAINSIRISSSTFSQASIDFDDGTVKGFLRVLSGNLLINTTVGSGGIEISSGTDLLLNAPYGHVKLSSWDSLYSTFNGKTLQQEINNLQTQINQLNQRVTALGG